MIAWFYFQLLGFFAGIHLAILAAYVCRRHPNASINTLLSLFFDIFVHWPWPLPVNLLDPPALCRGPDGCSLMPIMLPCIPPEFCSSSMTESTFSKIKEEIRRGYALTKVELFLLGFYLISSCLYFCQHTMTEFNIWITISQSWGDLSCHIIKHFNTCPFFPLLLNCCKTCFKISWDPKLFPF